MPLKDREARRAYMKTYHLAHPRKDYMREYVLDHLEKIKQQRNEAYKALTPQQKLEKQERTLELNRQNKLDVLKYYGNGTLACVQCGESRVGCLSIDHVNGGGNAHRRDLHIHGLILWLKKNKFPLGFRTLCMNCQFCNRVIRKIENKPSLAVNVR